MINKLETLALKAIVMKDPEYFTRKVCRYYSEKFHTPLLEVHDLPWTFVFNNYLEHVIESNNSRNEIYELSLEVIYPEMSKTEEQKNVAFAEMIERQEQEKMADKIIADKMKDTLVADENINMESTDFSHLDEEMEED